MNAKLEFTLNLSNRKGSYYIHTSSFFNYLYSVILYSIFNILSIVILAKSLYSKGGSLPGTPIESQAARTYGTGLYDVSLRIWKNSRLLVPLPNVYNSFCQDLSLQEPNQKKNGV